MLRLRRRPARLLRPLATFAGPKPKRIPRLRPLAALAAVSGAALLASDANASDAHFLRASALLAGVRLRFGAIGGTISPVDEALEALKTGGALGLKAKVADRLAEVVEAADRHGDAEILQFLGRNGALGDLLGAVAENRPTDHRRLVRTWTSLLLWSSGDRLMGLL